MIKHRGIYSLAAAATTALAAGLLSGCSGGGNSAASKVASNGTPTSTTSTTSGPISVQSVGQLTTVTGAGNGVVVTGMAGGTITGLSFLSMGGPGNAAGNPTGGTGTGTGTGTGSGTGTGTGNGTGSGTGGTGTGTGNGTGSGTGGTGTGTGNGTGSGTGGTGTGTGTGNGGTSTAGKGGINPTSNGGNGAPVLIAFTRTAAASGSNPVTGSTPSPNPTPPPKPLGQIYEMSVSGGTFSVPVNITNNAFACDSAAFSPDGSKIAYSCVDSSGHHQLYVMSTSGAGSTNLTNNAKDDDYAPCWSPDGTKIAFERHVGTTSVQIYVMGATEPVPTNLSNNAKVTDTTPSWCWKTNKITFARTGSGIFQMNADGSGQAHLGATGANDVDPACSYDGTMIAYTHATAASTSGATNSATSDIYVMNADGSGAKDITNGMGASLDAMPTWSPDNTKIGFQRTQKGVSLLYAANPDGSNLISVTTGPGNDSSPAISVPIVQPVVYIGANGMFGPSASGFLLGQQGMNVTSVVTFNATTPSGVILTSQTGISPNIPNLVFNISAADNLTSLSFLSGIGGQPITVFGGPAGSPILSPLPTGVLVSFDAYGGGVASVLPYVTSRAASAATRSVQNGALVYHAQFLSVWNGQGQNLAPHGATEVRIDAHTGRILSAK